MSTFLKWGRACLAAGFLLAMHLAAFAVIWVGFSWTALYVAFAAYLITGLGVTLGYHRYFSHKSYETSRFFQFILGVLGCAALENGPIEWSKNHIHHHKHSDEHDDLHSPTIKDFFYAHMGWIFDPDGPPVDVKLERLEKYPEIRFLDNYPWLVVALRFIGLYVLGAFLGSAYNTSGWQLVVWGGVIATLWTWHITWSVNSVVHIFGKRRFATTDNSRNNFIIAVLALGEGNHNNHHAYANLARQGLYWYEPDFTWYVIVLLEKLGIVWKVKRPGPEVYALAGEMRKGRRELNRLVATGVLTRDQITTRMYEYQQALAEAVRNFRRGLRSIEHVQDKAEAMKQVYTSFTEAAASARRIVFGYA